MQQSLQYLCHRRGLAIAPGILSCACIPLLVCLFCDSAAGGRSTRIFHLPDIHMHSHAPDQIARIKATAANKRPSPLPIYCPGFLATCHDSTGNASAACNSSKFSEMDPKVSSDKAALSSGADSRQPKSSYAYAVLCWAVSIAFSCTMANSFW